VGMMVFFVAYGPLQTSLLELLLSACHQADTPDIYDVSASLPVAWCHLRKYITEFYLSVTSLAIRKLKASHPTPSVICDVGPQHGNYSPWLPSLCHPNLSGSDSFKYICG